MSGDLLGRIDDVVADWEASPLSWVPGDPLHPRPRGWPNDEQTIRPMVEVLDDADTSLVADAWLVTCESCQVAWAAPAESCWICGEPGMREWERAMLANPDRHPDRATPRPAPPTRVTAPSTLMFVPSVSGPAAPTVAELRAGTDLSGVVVGVRVDTSGFEQGVARAQEAAREFERAMTTALRAYLRRFANAFRASSSTSSAASPLGDHYRRRQLARRRRNRR